MSPHGNGKKVIGAFDLPVLQRLRSKHWTETLVNSLLKHFVSCFAKEETFSVLPKQPFKLRVSAEN
jgi:hypothetical protein